MVTMLWTLLLSVMMMRYLLMVDNMPPFVWMSALAGVYAAVRWCWHNKRGVSTQAGCWLMSHTWHTRNIEKRRIFEWSQKILNECLCAGGGEGRERTCDTRTASACHRIMVAAQHRTLFVSWRLFSEIFFANQAPHVVYRSQYIAEFDILPWAVPSCSQEIIYCLMNAY